MLSVLLVQAPAFAQSPAIEQTTSESAGNLTIKQGTTSVIDIANGSAGGVLTITGDISNSGTLYVVSSNSSLTHAVLQAANIVNGAGGQTWRRYASKLSRRETSKNADRINVAKVAQVQQKEFESVAPVDVIASRIQRYHSSTRYKSVC